MIFFINGKYRHIENAKSVLTEDEHDFLQTYRIKINDTEKFRHLISIHEKVIEGFKQGLIEEENIEFAPVDKSHYVQSDCLDRVLNPATGKHYDSKSKYYADLKATGHMIVEPGMEKKRDMRGDYNVTKELKAAYHQVMGV